MAQSILVHVPRTRDDMTRQEYDMLLDSVMGELEDSFGDCADIEVCETSTQMSVQCDGVKHDDVLHAVMTVWNSYR